MLSLSVNISLYLPPYHFILVSLYQRPTIIWQKSTNGQRLIKQANINKRHFYRFILHHAEPLVTHVEFNAKKWHDTQTQVMHAESRGHALERLILYGNINLPVTFAIMSTFSLPITCQSQIEVDCGIYLPSMLVGDITIYYTDWHEKHWVT